MTDIFLEDRPSNKAGCLRLLIVALIAGGIVFAVMKGCEKFNKKPEPAGERSTPETGNLPAEPPSVIPAPEQLQATPPGSTPRSATPERKEAGAPSNPDSQTALTNAREMYAQKNYKKARSLGFDALDRAGNATDQQAAEAFLGTLHIEMIFSQIPMEEKVDYRIKSGDLVSKLSRTYKTTDRLIMRSNGIRDAARIQIGDGLRILNGTFKISVDKSDNLMLIMLNDRFFKRYKVGTGEYNKTPIGTFKVKNRMIEPDWWRPDGKKIPYGDPEHLLGTRWIGLDIKSYGIHGTRENERNTIGTQSSAGCVRMLNEEVEELYDYIPLGTEVIISD